MCVKDILRQEILRHLSPDTIRQLFDLTGNPPEFWLNAQRAYDLWQAKLDHQTEIEKIKPLRAA